MRGRAEPNGAQVCEGALSSLGNCFFLLPDKHSISLLHLRTQLQQEKPKQSKTCFNQIFCGGPQEVGQRVKWLTCWIVWPQGGPGLKLSERWELERESGNVRITGDKGGSAKRATLASP